MQVFILREQKNEMFFQYHIYLVIYPFEADVCYNTNTPYHTTITLDCFVFLLATVLLQSKTKHQYFKIIVLRACIWYLPFEDVLPWNNKQIVATNSIYVKNAQNKKNKKKHNHFKKWMQMTESKILRFR